MIISDKHKFAFIHIPKCAGTSVRNPLSSLNEWKLAGPPWYKEHCDIGELDYAHIPLFTLRNYFPTEFRAIQEYWSFAVMRDPFTRFASSVSQRLKMYTDRPIQNRSPDEIRRSVDEIIEYLGSQPKVENLLPPEYVHFQKQIDYIKLDNEYIVDKIYLVNEVETILNDLGRIVGEDLLGTNAGSKNMSQKNMSVAYRNELLRRVVDRLWPIKKHLAKVLSRNIKERIKAQVYIPRDQRMEQLFQEEKVRYFIEDYYKEDIALFEHLSVTADCLKSETEEY